MLFNVFMSLTALKDIRGKFHDIKNADNPKRGEMISPCAGLEK